MSFSSSRSDPVPFAVCRVIFLECQSVSVRKLQTLKGFRDFTPETMLLRQRVIAIFRSVFERHGYEPIDTPVLEYMEVLSGKAGENEKLMYGFRDRGDREVGLRYDLTVPLARFVAMHQNEIVMPFKRYHIAPVWRAENPQRGRFREFWQCDADIVGSPSMLADAESIGVLVDALHEVNLSGAVVSINHRGLLRALAEVAGIPGEQAGLAYRAIDKLGKIGPDGVRAELVAAGSTDASATRVLDLITATGTPDELLDEAGRSLEGVEGGGEAVAELRELVGFVEAHGVPRSAWKVDLSLARGIDYYTGPVYEAIVDEPKIGSVAGAGRYDGLIGTFLGRDVPATGMSLGFERILEVIQEFDLLSVPRSAVDVFVPVFAETLATASHTARELRQRGIATDLSVQLNRNLGDQLKFAARRGIPFAVIIGSEELDRGIARVRNLASGAQDDVPLAVLEMEISMLIENFRERSGVEAPVSTNDRANHGG